MNIFTFPKYPFIWNYNDMYEIINYDIEEYIDETDTINKLKEIYIDHKIVKTKQIIKRENIKNINIHTWYLSEEKIYDSNENDILISINKKIDYKKKVYGFIFDPNNIFDISNTFHKKNKNDNIVIIKNINNISRNLDFMNYIHVHTINNICRFSPGTNNIIKIKDLINNDKFYTILDKIIVINEIIII